MAACTVLGSIFIRQCVEWYCSVPFAACEIYVFVLTCMLQSAIFVMDKKWEYGTGETFCAKFKTSLSEALSIVGQLIAMGQWVGHNVSISTVPEK